MHISRFSNFRLAAIVSAFLLVSIAPAQIPSGPRSGSVKVMTYNINEGSDFIEVLSATDVLSFIDGVQSTLDEVTASNPPLRMRAVAHQIGITQPDLVGLQEVSTWLEGPPSSPSVLYDMLQELMDELTKQGLHYRVAVVIPEFQLAGPLDLTMTNWLVVQDFDVMLARSDKADLTLSNLRWGHFNTLLPVTTPGGSFHIERGWGAADATLHGQTFRFIVTHLENYIAQAPATLLIQEAQAKELTDGPAYVDMPVIIAGDFNADATGKDASIVTYQEMLSLGFSDAWGALYPKNPGETWQLVDSSPVGQPTQRIDYIFFSNDKLRPLTSARAGEAPNDKIGGLWPSDHAGVRAHLQLGLD